MEGSEAHCWFIGVDGCKAGWFYVASNGRQYCFGVVSNIRELIAQFERIGKIVIDIPIGLHDKGNMPRSCDVLARQKLKPRGSTVFPAPVRPCLYAHDYREACEISHTLTGKKLSQQAFNILKKIRAYTGAIRTSIPALSGHPFRFNPDTDSGISQPVFC